MPDIFSQRYFETPSDRGDEEWRSAYTRDRARVLHSASFRRLQGKTQIMGIREGDFHRTRLTHSIECSQIGQGLQTVLERKAPDWLKDWFPERDLIEGACFAHDLGHPPFGHSGEKALHTCMKDYGILGGFEGNAQTLRILSHLEKYQRSGQGLNPTRRFLLAVLKYPSVYSLFTDTQGNPPSSPPKCVYEANKPLLEWLFSAFTPSDQAPLFIHPKARQERLQTFDCSIMELADDIAYGIHDIEDMIGRGLVSKDIFYDYLKQGFTAFPNGTLYVFSETYNAESITKELYKDSYSRKQMISKLVGFCIRSSVIRERKSFEHPLLKAYAILPPDITHFLEHLKDMSMTLLIQKPNVQHLTHRGMRIVKQLFEALHENPKALVPNAHKWPDDLDDIQIARRICDYIAGMTDSYAEKIYGRLFLPSVGNTTDEL